MYKEPWSDILEYPEEHIIALETELQKEAGSSHVLADCSFKLLAKREDRDDVLVKVDSTFYIVHLTWSGSVERSGYPLTDEFKSVKELEARLAQDSVYF